LDQRGSFKQRANNNAVLVALGLLKIKANRAAQFFKAAIATVQALHFDAVNIENGFVERARLRMQKRKACHGPSQSAYH
jgi:hypothetical protein